MRRYEINHYFKNAEYYSKFVILIQIRNVSKVFKARSKLSHVLYCNVNRRLIKGYYVSGIVY